MKLIKKSKLEIRADNFVPTLNVTFEVCPEDLVDGCALYGEDEMAMKIGREFLKALGVINERKD